MRPAYGPIRTATVPAATNCQRTGTHRDEVVTESNGGERREAAMNDPTPARAAPADGRSAGEAIHSRSATWALGLGVCGVGLGFLLMFAVLTPAAIVYGIRGLREIRAEPSLRGAGTRLDGDRTGRGRAVPLGRAVRRPAHRGRL